MPWKLSYLNYYGERKGEWWWGGSQKVFEGEFGEEREEKGGRKGGKLRKVEKEGGGEQVRRRL